MLESEADRLAMIQAVGGEEFDTGHAERLLAIFDRAYEESVLTGHVVANRRPILHCRTSDIAAHELVKQYKVTRVSDGSVFFVKDFEPDGTGMTIVVLRA